MILVALAGLALIAGGAYTIYLNLMVARRYRHHLQHFVNPQIENRAQNYRAHRLLLGVWMVLVGVVLLVTL